MKFYTARARKYYIIYKGKNDCLIGYTKHCIHAPPGKKTPPTVTARVKKKYVVFVKKNTTVSRVTGRTPVHILDRDRNASDGDSLTLPLARTLHIFRPAATASLHRSQDFGLRADSGSSGWEFQFLLVLLTPAGLLLLCCLLIFFVACPYYDKIVR